MAVQPDGFGFGDDELMLRDSARAFFAEHGSLVELHELVAGDHHSDRPNDCLWKPAVWRRMVELGWPAVCVPEASGGSGMPAIAAVALAEEIGRACVPSPLLSTITSSFVLRECRTPAAVQALSDIAAGTAVTLAITDGAGSWDSEHTDVAVTDSGALTGAASYVQDARKCDRLLVSARQGGAVGLYLVDTAASGLVIIPDRIVDLTRDQAHVTFTDVVAVEVAPPGVGNRVIDQALPAILCIVSADMVGAGEWLLQTTAEYAKTRIQFERPLGFFQAIKHPLVNVMLQIDAARSLTYGAACAIDHEPEVALRAARMAKSAASEMAVSSASRAVQFHGGIGFTWECFVHLFFKRQMHNQILYGDAQYQRARLADTMIGPAAAHA